METQLDLFPRQRLESKYRFQLHKGFPTYEAIGEGIKGLVGFGLFAGMGAQIISKQIYPDLDTSEIQLQYLAFCGTLGTIYGSFRGFFSGKNYQKRIENKINELESYLPPN